MTLSNAKSGAAAPLLDNGNSTMPSTQQSRGRGPLGPDPRPGGPSPGELELALFADLGGLTDTVTQVVELRPANIALGYELELGHDW